MYKRIKITGKHSITFESFPKTAKNVSRVYYTGIRNFTCDDSYNYSIVIGTFRIIYSIERTVYCKNQ